MVATKEISVTGVVGNSGIPTTSGRVDPIGTFNIVTGSADDQREANTIVIDKLCLRINATKPSGAAGDAAYFRVVLFADRQCNGATPAITDLLTTGTGGVNCGFNGDFVSGFGGSRFKILRDYYFNITATGSVTAQTPNITKCWKWELRPKHTVHFDSTAGAITDITGGEIFLATLSDVNTATVTCTQQTVYHDG